MIYILQRLSAYFREIAFCGPEEKNVSNVPGAVESDISRSAIAIETNAQRCSMAWKAQFRRDTLCARSITACADRKLRAHFDVLVIGYDGWIPCSKALGIAIISAAFRRCAVESAVVVKLLYK